jgi:transposase
MKFKEYNQEQPWLIPPDIDDEIPPHDLCRVINDIVDIIDISSIEMKYKEEGNTAYHPRMMLKTLYYSYSQKIFSSRKIAQEHERNIFYWYLSGKQRPDFRTINLFRSKHVSELKQMFIEITKICIRLGLVGFSTVALDGTKIHANASRDKFRDAAWLANELSAMSMGIDNVFEEADKIDREEDSHFGKDLRGDEIPEDVADRNTRRRKIVELQKQLKEKDLKRINETDTEAKIMKSRGSFLPAYNCQALVDGKNQIILSADVTDSPNDWYQVKPRVEEVKEEFSRKPEVLLADTGYRDGASLDYLYDEDIDGYIPAKMPKKIQSEKNNTFQNTTKYKKDQFAYREETDVYVCPEGHELKRTSIKLMIEARKIGEPVRYHRYQCSNKYCEKSGLCHSGNNGKIIKRFENQDIRDAMARKIRSEAGWAKYCTRMKIVEPVFGNIKYNMGFCRFSLRGLAKTRGEFFIAACIHNMTKIKNHIIENNITDLKNVLGLV